MTVGNTPVLRIGILTHNVLHHTQRCIASLQAHTSVPWQAIVLDNASTDATPAWLSAIDDPRIVVHCHAENLGVGGGRNRLLQTLLPAMHDDDVLVFLDNDIEVGHGWTQPFLAAFAEHPRLGVAGRWAFSMLVHATWRDILAEHRAVAGPVDTVQGCCFWIRGAAARAVGLFDEALGRFWHEDDDYCIRALHAGWDVRRVPCAAIAHHEHGSGVALKPERLAGSLANQAYLVTKWRAMGAIDQHGVPVRPVPEVTGQLSDQLGARLRRGRPLLRTELSSAIADATELLRGDVTDDRAGVLASPTVRTLLHDATIQDAGDTQRRAREAVAQVANVLCARRGDGLSEASASGGGRAFSAVCNPAAWDDPRWSDTYTQSFRDGAGVDFYARTEVCWRDGHLMHAMRATNALHANARVLVVGHPSERVIAALTHVVASVEVRDQHPPSMHEIIGGATRVFGAARVNTGSWPIPKAIRVDPYDVVLCPNASRYAPPAGLPKLWRTLADCTRSGGHVGLGVSVRLTGPRNGRWAECDLLADDVLLREQGLRRLGRFDASVSDETLLAAIPMNGADAWRPRLARAVPPHRVTLATLFCRRIAEDEP